MRKKVAGKPDSYLVELRVIDNGISIPQKILDKIFQPFFTTIPTCLPAGTVAIGTTGQGTGLGLSLAYDIVKAHGGVPKAIGMKVETKEGEGAEFMIHLNPQTF